MTLSSNCTYRFVDEIETLERALAIVEHPIPDDLRRQSAWIPCIQYLRHGLVFILAMAKQAVEEPETLEVNQQVAEEVWAQLEPFITTLGIIYAVRDEQRAVLN